MDTDTMADMNLKGTARVRLYAGLSSAEFVRAMLAEHQRFDRSAAALIEILNTDFVRAATLFRALAEEIEEHETLEDEVLFPAFEQLVGVGSRGPIAPLRLDHRELNERRKVLNGRFETEGGDSEGIDGMERSLVSFRALMRSHYRREKQAYEIYGPTLDIDELRKALAAS